VEEIFNIFSLKGKKAVITGGAGVLCAVIASGLGRAGAEIAVCDINSTDEIVKRLKKEGISAKGYHIDVMDLDSINKCRADVVRDFGMVDILVNGAGGNMKEATTSKDLAFFDLPLSALEKVIKLNLLGGAMMPAQVFGKIMAENPDGGSIINISSMNSYRPLTRIPGYSAAKAAVSNFTQWLAVHFAMEYNNKLRVNAIAPGFFLTEQLRYLLLDENNNLTQRGNSIITHTPMGKFGKAEDLTGVCIWLASEASSFVTGAIIPVDGGFNSYSGV
jgi:NAD(P)-dependent dehydrogenase (short-subunit alcohol dehydrogenase family)